MGTIQGSGQMNECRGPEVANVITIGGVKILGLIRRSRRS